MTESPQTMLEKIWNRHLVHQSANTPAILYIDLHLIHEVTSPQAFNGLREKGLKVRRPDLTIATMDHSSPTISLSISQVDELCARQLEILKTNCEEFSIQLFDLDNPMRGIVHVIGPELGLTLPGKTIVCGDSHTATHGAFGALAFGIGTSEVEHVLATQCLLQSRPKTYQVKFSGRLSERVTSKDMILALISKIGIAGGTGHVFEYCGTAIQALNMEERMTLCNMSIEAGARAGMIAPDETTFEYLAGRKYTPNGAAWEEALATWRKLPSDPGAAFDKSLNIDISDLEPMITYGTNPEMGISIDDPVPDPDKEPDLGKRSAMEKALGYMNLDI